jgi:hypothetical protein
MSARIGQPTGPGWRFWLLWMLATIVGAAAGLVLSLSLNSILVAALGTDGSRPWTAIETALIILFKAAEGGVMGMGIGLGQWLVLRKHLKQTGWWVLATVLPLFLQGAFNWSLPSVTPSVQVGVNTMLSLGIFFGLCQWFVLRGRVPYAGWWIAISIAGWGLALALIVATELAQLHIEPFLGMVFFTASLLVPFAVAGGGLVWLLRQTTPARQAIAS